MAKAVASQAAVEETAQQILSDGGNCLDAVVAGFFAAAALEAGTLFAPVGVLVAGVGRGARSIDGRSLQHQGRANGGRAAWRPGSPSRRQPSRRRHARWPRWRWRMPTARARRSRPW
jgi:hypothetical protein